MSSSTVDKCCVCAKPTTTRCGACQAAGVDVFFCSKEHQKLVYFAHKQVCGERANPFLWPDLSKEEAEEAIKHMDEVAHFGTFPLGSVKKDIGDRFPRFAGKIPSLIRSLVGTTDATPHPPELRQDLLILIRGAEHRRRMMRENPFAPSPSITQKSGPFHFAATPLRDYLRDYINDVRGVFPLNAHWFVLLQHQFLINGTLHYLGMKQMGQGEINPLYLASKRLHPELLDKIALTNPEIGSLRYTHTYMNMGRQ
ncbi:hypothetical protein JCM6882_002426 [Rhodosporidiobolus microsporus]